MKRLTFLLLLLILCVSQKSFAQSLNMEMIHSVIGHPLINHQNQHYFNTCLQQQNAETQSVAQPVARTQSNSFIISVRLSSNPASFSSKLLVTLSRTSAVVYRLYDVTGHLLLTVEKSEAVAGTHEWFIDTNKLPTGAYLINVTDGISEQTLHLSILH
jgi:hypothetical protein